MGDFQHGGENPLAQASAGVGKPESCGSRARGRLALGKWTLLGEKAASLGHI